ncbi:S41 family peptidase [Lyngbya confervoides]|uniref:Carboxyl-terminal-processing protease n=1 Tax=Lyngbya confervoides BDU141951 TaxID=1574623 RepID=A0ABD4T952_9CYAN|nr:S41 family peptidase [Lyngbya confervoides]MCM1985141.1 S41 family peptidase [Lyngbya confervoides BDU141951]
MKRKLLQITLILLVQICLGLGFLPAAQAMTEDQKLFNDAWRVVNQAYVDETFNHQNWWALREKALKKPFANREAAYSAIQDLLGSLEDPFTRFLRPAQYRSLRTSTAGELSGVGLQVITNPETGQLEVLSPIVGSPAAQAGLKAHDIILAIDGQDATQMSLDEAAELMRGTSGTTVVLTIQTGSDSQASHVSKVSIRRDRIELHPVQTDLRTLPEGGSLAYIQLNQFNANAAPKMREAIDQMEKQQVRGYILDLRNNPGGLLQAGVEIARYWLDPAIIVYSIDRHSMLNSFSATQEARTHAPLVVLVNGGSASASEILAGALQDNERATLVGETTFGKGSIQSLFDLPDGSGMAVTIAKYETPNHQNINKVGIIPDIEVKAEGLLPSQFGTPDDPQYQIAVSTLRAHLS